MDEEKDLIRKGLSVTCPIERQSVKIVSFPEIKVKNIDEILPNDLKQFKRKAKFEEIFSAIRGGGLSQYDIMRKVRPFP